MGKVLGHTRLTVPGNPSLQDRPAVVKSGGKLLEDILEEKDGDIASLTERIGELETALGLALDRIAALEKDAEGAEGGEETVGGEGGEGETPQKKG